MIALTKLGDWSKIQTDADVESAGNRSSMAQARADTSHKAPGRRMPFGPSCCAK
jgi:hypothetical protein